ncbi:MAG: YafY family transcriptional regulator [Dehalococcoidales bacterium]|nr:YafY family transcriptional regulator [Dehalococcoidales bacterium]
MKIDRLMGILTFLMQCDKSTASELADRFEVSRRTVLRDIDTLSQAGIPVYTTQGGNGGVAIMPEYKINANILTVDELQNIIAGLRSLSSVTKTSNIERLIQKLSPEQNAMVSLNDHILIDLSSFYKDSLSEKIDLIKQAITKRRFIDFDYYYRKGKTRRKIEPYFIQFTWTSWYVYGFCTERQDFRLFKLNRLWEITLSEERFTQRYIPANAAERNSAFPDPYSVKLLFDKNVRFRLIEEYGLHCYTETDEGLLLDLDYTNRDYIKSWILSFGEAVTVLAPEDFRDEMNKSIENMFENYH